MREVLICDYQGTASVENCIILGTDFTGGGVFSTPTIDIVGTNEIRIRACIEGSYTRAMAYFSGIEMRY
jgi:hypothetical protein